MSAFDFITAAAGLIALLLGGAYFAYAMNLAWKEADEPWPFYGYVGAVSLGYGALIFSMSVGFLR